MKAAIVIVSFLLGLWLGWRFSCGWYQVLGAEPAPAPKPAKTYAEVVGRQDCKSWECMTGQPAVETAGDDE